MSSHLFKSKKNAKIWARKMRKLGWNTYIQKRKGSNLYFKWTVYRYKG